MPYCNDWGSCQRVYNYSKEFLRSGHQVDIICKNFSSIEDRTSIIDGITVVTPDDAITIKTNAERNIKDSVVSFCKQNALILRSLQWFYRIMYSEPNLFRGHESKSWAQENKLFILNYIKQNQINCVVISGPPFGLFYLASDIKSIGVKLVLDYRDPWNLWYEKFSFSEKYEKKAIELSDLVIASTSSLSSALKNKYKKRNIYPVLNGYVESSWEKLDIKKHKAQNKLVISYVGYILINNAPAFRNPQVFLRAARKFVKEHDDVEINFVGIGDDIENIELELTQYINFQNRVPVNEALSIVNNSDVVVVIHTAMDSSGNYIVCGKLYDYLKAGKYIISVGDHAKCNNELIDKFSAGIHCGNNERAIMECLNTVYQKWKQNGLKINIPKEIREYTREYQNKRFTEYINNILEETLNG